MLSVPSSVITVERNVLPNPWHPHIQRVRILSDEPFSLDARLLGWRASQQARNGRQNLIRAPWGSTRVSARSSPLERSSPLALGSPLPHITRIQSGRVPGEGRVRDWPVKVTWLVAQVSRVLAPEG